METERKFRRGIMVRRADRYSSLYLEAFPILYWDTYPGWDWQSWESLDKPQLYLRDLQEQCFASDIDGRVVCSDLRYYPTSVSAYDAVRMLKTLKESNKTYQDFSPSDYGDRVRCFAMWLKCDSILFQERRDRGDYRVSRYDVGSGVHRIRDMADSMSHEMLVRLGKADAA